MAVGRQVLRQLKRGAVAVVGSVVIVIGIILIPYPGPGWLVVFSGLAILSTEFDWAKRALQKAKGTYDDWQKWLEHQNPGVQLAVGLGTLAVTILTLWVLNSFGIFNNLFHWHADWMNSPLPIFHK